MSSIQDAVEAMKARLPVQRMQGDLEPGRKPAQKTKPVKFDDAARQEAHERNESVFNGPDCGKCGGQKRYVSSGGCVDCQIARIRKTNAENREAKALERAARSKNYFVQGKPCSRCQSTLKYRSGGQCVPCARNRALVSKAKQKQRDGMW